MRYELYKQISWEDDSIIFYVVECHNLKTLLTYIENYPLNSNENYLIIDNDSPNPINYKQLNLSSPPTENEHYKIIYECKLAKEHFRQMKEDDYDDCYLNYEILKLLCDSILATAEFQTAVYFEKYNAKENLSPTVFSCSVDDKLYCFLKKSIISLNEKISKYKTYKRG